ncbi:LysR family transcriptional regulator [Vibrio sp. SCSIO 43135]|uniref:LysR family transcriptional regulator n=1 Tax=Vibrio sp. SCSIO 43135 TaxID=2819096 RepID=UPI002075F841|nr:LysR family transcriptional regulator [Vibrio sp. SCSIO 43135]USD43626.1 LysR family transcriptional regulator [Vibrio sp. SCSIO 43135]
MNISYEQIRAFVAVAETGSFSAAARQLNKHRTTLGQVISNLEIEINMTLFDRSGKYPTLTEQGQGLFRFAKNLNDSSTAFESLCQSMESGVESDVTIYHTDLMPVELIKSTMQSVRSEFPNVNVNWLHRSVEEVKTGLHSGDADMGIVLVDARSQGASPRDYVHLMSMPFTLVASPEFVAEHDVHYGVKELKAKRQLLLEDYYYADVDRTMRVSPMIQRIENMSVFLELLKMGEGWAIAPVHAVEKALESGELVELKVDELNTQVRFPLAIWFMNQPLGRPVLKRVIDSLSLHSRKFEGLT